MKVLVFLCVTLSALDKKVKKTSVYCMLCPTLDIGFHMPLHHLNSFIIILNTLVVYIIHLAHPSRSKTLRISARTSLKAPRPHLCTHLHFPKALRVTDLKSFSNQNSISPSNLHFWLRLTATKSRRWFCLHF